MLTGLARAGTVPASGRTRGSRTRRSYTSAHGRLRRPRPLPRAVREPVPARLPGEVPRLGARDRVVASQPDRAHGGLPRRLPAALAGRRHPLLPALPPGGDRVLDLLRDVPPDGVALARRQRRPGEEGALPAPAR